MGRRGGHAADPAVEVQAQLGRGDLKWPKARIGHELDPFGQRAVPEMRGVAQKLDRLEMRVEVAAAGLKTSAKMAMPSALTTRRASRSAAAMSCQ